MAEHVQLPTSLQLSVKELLCELYRQKDLWYWVNSLAPSHTLEGLSQGDCIVGFNKKLE